MVHARLQDLQAGLGAEIDNGPVIPPRTVDRLACDARLQLIVEDEAGDPIRATRTMRIPPPWLVRQIRYRDGECRFPGCSARAFTQVHHVRWWSRGGRTEARNLILICAFHHRLVHEMGWSVKLDNDGVARWFHPAGTLHRSPSQTLDSVSPAV